MKKSNCSSKKSVKVPSVSKANVLCFAGIDSLHITRILSITGLHPESPCHIALTVFNASLKNLTALMPQSNGCRYCVSR